MAHRLPGHVDGFGLIVVAVHRLEPLVSALRVYIQYYEYTQRIRTRVGENAYWSSAVEVGAQSPIGWGWNRNGSEVSEVK